MCIIVIKKKGQKLPKKEILKNCYINNDDGCGYMFAEADEVNIKKGFFDFELFYKNLKNDYKKHNLKNKNLVMHFRIGTSGGLTASKCHPFPISNIEADLNKQNINCDIGVVHNGILTNYTYNKNKTSDTQNFIKDFLYYLYKIDNNFYKNKMCNILIDNQLDYNKLAILDKNDILTTYGDFIEDEGLLFSNTSYKTAKYYNYNYDYNYDYNYLKNYDYDDYYKYYYDYEDFLYSQYENGDITEKDFDFLLNDYDNFCDFIEDFKKAGGEGYSFTR